MIFVPRLAPLCCHLHSVLNLVPSVLNLSISVIIEGRDINGLQITQKSVSSNLKSKRIE